MNKITKESKIIVLGGSGFIGTNLVEALMEEGYDVLSIDRFGCQSGHGERSGVLGTAKFHVFSARVFLDMCQEAIINHIIELKFIFINYLIIFIILIIFLFNIII